MSYLIERDCASNNAKTLYPVAIPGYAKTRRSGPKPLHLYMSLAQLKVLRANAAKAILKAQANDQ